MIKFMKFGVLLPLLSTSTFADVLSVHCPLGCPENPIKNDLVFTHVYALSNNPNTKFADWVAYEVNPVNFGPSTGRIWKVDPLLDDSETLRLMIIKALIVVVSKLIGVIKLHWLPLLVLNIGMK